MLFRDQVSLTCCTANPRVTVPRMSLGHLVYSLTHTGWGHWPGLARRAQVCSSFLCDPLEEAGSSAHAKSQRAALSKSYWGNTTSLLVRAERAVPQLLLK